MSTPTSRAAAAVTVAVRGLAARITSAGSVTPRRGATLIRRVAGWPVTTAPSGTKLARNVLATASSASGRIAAALTNVAATRVASAAAVEPVATVPPVLPPGAGSMG